MDFIDNCYHGQHYAGEGELCSMAPEDGTTTCHRYCAAYVVSNEKPVTLAMTCVRNDEDEADAVEHVLARVENYPFEIDLLLADSGFYNERVIRHAREIAATVVHVPKKGKRMKNKLDTHNSYMTTYRMYNDSERELRFPLAVAVSYHAGDQVKSGEVVRGYVACGVTDRSAKQVERLSRKRSGVETTYRLLRQARGITTTRDPIVRFAITLVAALLENLWLVLRWAGATCPRNSDSRCSVTGFGTNRKRSYTAGGRSKRTWLVCQRHRKRQRADRGQPTGYSLGVSNSCRQRPSKSR
jgi:hypothetical protein